VALAIPRPATDGGVDPFGVGEPWRHAVIDAQQARRRFTEAEGTFRAGPLRDRLGTIGDRLDDAVQECWRIAKQGQLLAEARKRIDDREVQWELQRIAEQLPSGTEASPTQARTIDSLRSQLATAERMDRLIASTRDELDLLNARLDESVTQAIELSVSNRSDRLDPLGADVDAIVEDLESLRLAMGTVDGGDPSVPVTLPGAGLPDGQPATEAAAGELGLGTSSPDAGTTGTGSTP
jgi:hypothetical protein